MNWLNVYGGFVAFLIRVESYDYSDATIRMEWDRFVAFGFPSLDSPELGIG